MGLPCRPPPPAATAWGFTSTHPFWTGGVGVGAGQKGRKPAPSGSGDFCGREGATSISHHLLGTGRPAFKETQWSMQRRNVTCPTSGCCEPRSSPDGFRFPGEMISQLWDQCKHWVRGGRGGSPPWTRRWRWSARTTSLQLLGRPRRPSTILPLTTKGW